MKYKIIFLILFLSSCTTSQQTSINKKKIFTPYSSKGFALIYQEIDYENKIINKKMDNEKLQVAHKKLGTNKILILRNPDNNKSIELNITKKVNYPNFFNVIITKKVAEDLQLDEQFPFLEVYERVKNRSFVAKKAEIFTEEKNVYDKAPVTKIKIDNISQNKNLKIKNSTKKKIFSILIGEFYSIKSANQLKNNLTNNYINKELLKVKKLGNNRYELSAGPYRSINTLKEAYFALNKYGFEDLDIKQNE